MANMASKKIKVDKTEIGDPAMMRTRINCFLPDDILFIILLCLPAGVLYNVMRLVCRKWYNLIKSPFFISSHLQNYSSTNLLLIYDKIGGFSIEPWSDYEDFEAKDLKFQYSHKVSASCNGLIHIIGPVDRTLYCPSYVLNPVTKQYLTLPLFPVQLKRTSCCFAYVAASRVYKVMHYTNDESRCLILTVGVDKEWRPVDISQLSFTKKKCLIYGDSLSLRGFVYWLSLSFFPQILRFDMETETFSEIPVSPKHSYVTCEHGLLAMGNSVCLWFQIERFKFEFWLLNDPETGHGQWEKLSDIDLEGQWWSPKYMKPVGWLISRELLVFRAREEIMVYNVNTGQAHETKVTKKVIGYCRVNSHVHVDSLVPLNNLSLVMTPGLPHKGLGKVYSKENMMADFQELKEEPSYEELKEEPSYEELKEEPSYEELKEEPSYEELKEEPSKFSTWRCEEIETDDTTSPEVYTKHKYTVII